MKPLWQALAWTTGVLGAAVTGAAVGVAARSSRIATQRKADDPLADEPLGALKPDRQSTVAADDGVPLVVEEIKPSDGGHADLTVVLVHGYTLDARCWHFQRRDLPKLTDPRVRLVQYDQRSHGRSGRSSKKRSTIEQLGRDLDAVLRATASRGPVVLVGHSMGGMAIMALAERQPRLFRDRVCAVALIGTSAGEIGASGLARPWLSKHNPLTRGLALLAGIQPGLVERARSTGGQLTWSIIRGLAFGDGSVPPKLVDLMADMIGATSIEVVTDFLDTIGSHDRKAALAGLRHCEVLVLGGDADRLTPFSHAEVIAAELPEAELVRVEGAGHMVMMERHELVTEHLVALVRRSAPGKEEVTGS
ncbi:pimeloyl-ACP methyl ester carboxylesterase [Saccharopolyspora erythraea NRRL 2338]|uniref:Alpha/beta hydrolase n=1 Tax=Saccharopolyspora erythraea TaxID=1836 RepID=A0ABN1CPX8_SACER|nr:alpha/beta hydrolase [Saccharopolyspora erythraea]EQD82302.1 alpha/beta hydrolase [Saccharopolyspora erythraea D]PFG99569.1 pimeloyl-ACP methyl ester carboxylesterase [Saccharopolyspora erythraea NRRL 2338]QRK89466.1 alpha/beta hydrolase [Saccharopolyspora erythraea]